MIEVNQFQALGLKALELTISYLPKVLLALLLLYFGIKISNYISALIGKGLDKKNVDASLKPFLLAILRSTLKLMVLIASLGMIGIETTSFIAVLGAAGLAVGLALQGSLSNFAGGVLILIFRPFNVGEFIEAQSFSGTVKEIQILYTILNTTDNKVVIIPNGALAGGNIINFSREKLRRVDLMFGVDYKDDLKKAQAIILKVLNEEEHVLKLEDKMPFVRVGELAESSVNFTVRAWAPTEFYWDVYFNVVEKVKESFDQEGISIPFPQRDLNIKMENPFKL